MSIENILIAVYLVSLIIAWQAAQPQVVISMLLLLIIILLGKIDAKTEATKLKESIASKLDSITMKVDSIPKTDDIKESFNRDIMFLDRKISELRNEYTVEMEKQYRELARKILEVENSVGEIRRTVGAAFGSLEERLGEREEE
ncbi:MAG: hypothetical protein HYT72_00095 [Candidatus Aenigmarchaeota archaeon]|nr:hypothetical protein [Candidatus Aenigmarchaeota archaeon]